MTRGYCSLTTRGPSRKTTSTSHKRLFFDHSFSSAACSYHRKHAMRVRPDPARVSYDPGCPDQQRWPDASQSLFDPMCKLSRPFTHISGRDDFCEKRSSTVAQHGVMIDGDHGNLGYREWEQISGHNHLHVLTGNLRQVFAWYSLNAELQAIHRMQRVDRQNTLQSLQYKQLHRDSLLFYSSVARFYNETLLHSVRNITMKYTLISTATTALAAALDISELPTCSIACLATAIGGLGCGVKDLACSCQKAEQLTPVMTSCVQLACSDPADQSKAIKSLSGICAAVGFPIEVPAPPASSATAEPTPEPTSSKAPVETQSCGTVEPEYSEYPTATDALSEYPGLPLPLILAIFLMLTCSASTRVTNDVPNLPSSHSDLVPVPSFVDTVIVSHPSP